MNIWKTCCAVACLVVWLFSGCGRGRENSVRDSFYHSLFVKSFNDSVASNPLRALEIVDSLLLQQTDSVRFYEIQVLKSKAKMFLSQDDSSYIILCRAEAFCQENENLPDVDALHMRVLNMKGNVLCRKAMFDSALVAFQGACSLCRKLGDKESLVDLSLNLADAYLSNGRYDLSSYWYRYSLALSDSLQIPEERRFPAYAGLGQVNMELRDFEASDFYYNQAGRHYDKMTPYEKRFYLNNRGNSYYYRQDYPASLGYFFRLLEFLRAYPEMEFERNVTMVNIADVYLSMGKTDSSSYYLDLCSDFFRQQRNNTALYYIDTQLIGLALKQRNVGLAEKRLRNAVKPDYVEPNMVHIRNRYLQQYFEETGDFKKAYHFLLENKRIDDSIRNERVKMKAAEIALKYRQDSTLMNKEILIRKQQNEVLELNQRLYRFILTVLLVGAVLFVLVYYRKRKRDRQEWKLRQAMTSLRLDNIRNRISPHFIFNVLSREISLHKEENDNLLNLVKLIRRNLELASRLSVTLEEELDFVRTYLRLEHRSLGEEFRFLLQVDVGVDTRSVQVPSMLLQIPVENAVKHGLRDKEGRRNLWVNICRDGDNVEIVIRDNGGGYHVCSTNSGTGMGMKVLTQTIQLLNSQNRCQIVMTINNVEPEGEEAGCEVRFTIPLDYSYQLNNVYGENV